LGRPISTQLARRIFSTLRWPDAPLLIYLVAFARQCTWGLPDQLVAWTTTAVIAGSILLLHAALRPARGESPPLKFWMVVGLPLILMFLLRLPFPDINYDQMNYHLVNGERALHGWPFKSYEYFPGVLLPNPAPDMVEGISRYLVGYRLGPVINLVALLWAALSLELILRDFVLEELTRFVAVLFALVTEHSLYLLNMYMVDLLALPLITEALFYILNIQKLDGKKEYTIVHVASLLGMSIAFKLTNIAIAIPLLGLLATQLAKDGQLLRPLPILTVSFALAVPSIPFSLFMYRQTGSPVFPFFNNLFHSPYFPSTAYRDELRGPRGILESLLWPLWGTIESSRISAMDHGGLYFGKISLIYPLAIVAACARSMDMPIRTLSLATAIMILLWSFGSGDIRYAIPIEVIGAILIVYLASHAWAKLEAHQTFSKIAILLAITFLGLLTFFIFMRGVVHKEYYSTNNAWDSIGQPTILSAPMLYAKEAKELFLDRDPRRFIDEETARVLSDVEVWINSIDATSAVEIATRPDIPIISLGKATGIFDYMESPASQERLKVVLERFRDKRMFTLVQVPDFFEAAKVIERSGLRITTIAPIEVEFFSRFRKLKFLLIGLEFA